MPVTVTCPACGKQLQSATQPPQGVLMKCPGCQTQFRYQTPAEGLPPAMPAPAAPKAGGDRKPSADKHSRARSAAQARQKQTVQTESEPQPARGGWLGFLLMTSLLFTAVAGGAWYFGKDHFPQLAGLFGGKGQSPAPEPSPAAPEEAAWDKLFDDKGGDKREIPEEVAAIDPIAPPDPAATDEGERMRPLRFASKGPDGVLLDPLGNSILDLEYSPDGRVLATFDSAGQGTLWDLKLRRGIDISFNHRGGQAHSENARHVAFSADGRTLVFGTTHNVTVVELPAAKLRWQKGGVVQGMPLIVSPSVRFVVMSEQVPEKFPEEYKVKVFDVGTGNALFTMPDTAVGYGFNIAFSQDDKLLALEDNLHQKVRLFTLPDGRETAGITGIIHARDMAFVDGGKTLLLPESGGERHLWDVSNPDRPKLLHRVPQNEPQIVENRVTPDGKTLGSLPYLWDVAARKPRAKIAGNISHGDFSPDSRLVAGWPANYNAEVYVADAANGATITVLNPGMVEEFHPHRPSCIAFSHDIRQVAIGTLEGSVVLRNISASTPAAGTIATSGTAAPGEIAAFQFSIPENLKYYFLDSGKNDNLGEKMWISPDRKWLVTAGKFMTIWDLQNRRQHMVLSIEDGRGRTLNVPDQKAFDGGFGSAKVARPFPNVFGWLFHRDGKKLTVSGYSSSMFHYDVAAQTHYRDLHEPGCVAIRYSPDGRLAAAWIVVHDPPLVPGRGRSPQSKEYWELMVLDGGDGKQRKSLGRFLPKVNSGPYYDPYTTLSFSADGKRLAAIVFEQVAGYGAPRVRVWDWESGQEHHVTVDAKPLSRIEIVEAGNALVTVTDSLGSGSIYLVANVFDLDTGSKRADLPLNRGHTGNATAIAFDATRPVFASADEHGMVLLRDLKSGEPRARFQAHSSSITAICFTSDGKQLATAAGDRTVKLWDIEKLMPSK
jgi:WD40 repeat protein